ncbi:hypothetical protein V6615_12165 [Oscillospiraceae bacterium PP1C4]
MNKLKQLLPMLILILLLTACTKETTRADSAETNSTVPNNSLVENRTESLTPTDTSEITTNIPQHSESEQSQNKKNDIDYGLPFGENEFGNYADIFGRTVSVYREGNYLCVSGDLDGFTFDFQFNAIDRFDITTQEGYTLLPSFDNKTQPELYFHVKDREENVIEYVHFSFDSGQLYVAFGDEAISTIMDKI